jgi:hypothetical protein
MTAPAAVHPWAPRFAQAITGVLCLEALLFGTPAVVAVAFALVLVNLLAPRYSPVAWMFRMLAPAPGALEPAAPVRFSQVLAAVFLGAASVLLLTGPATLGWALTGMVAALALLSALTGICVGCEVYRLVLARRSAHDGDDPRRLLGLEGEGPWLVMLTAPGCARCEPAARQLEEIAGAREVRRVDLARTPDAARLPVRSVPAALAVGRDGSLRAVRAGRLDPRTLAEVAAAV